MKVLPVDEQREILRYKLYFPRGVSFTSLRQELKIFSEDGDRSIVVRRPEESSTKKDFFIAQRWVHASPKRVEEIHVPMPLGYTSMLVGGVIHKKFVILSLQLHELEKTAPEKAKKHKSKGVKEDDWVEERIHLGFGDEWVGEYTIDCYLPEEEESESKREEAFMRVQEVLKIVERYGRCIFE